MGETETLHEGNPREQVAFELANGVYILPNGEVYQGEILNGKRHGLGMYTFKSGAIYEGNWRQNAKHGYGVYHYIDGSKYVGNWVNDKREGLGTYCYTNGDIYRGKWHKHVRHGPGLYRYASNGVIYEGVWKADKRVEKDYSKAWDDQIQNGQNVTKAAGDKVSHSSPGKHDKATSSPNLTNHTIERKPYYCKKVNGIHYPNGLHTGPGTHKKPSTESSPKSLSKNHSSDSDVYAKSPSTSTCISSTSLSSSSSDQ